MHSKFWDALDPSPDIVITVCGSAAGETCPGYLGIALGNILGSNLFNTLAVVGIAGAIHPMQVEAAVLTRDVLVMALLTLSLFVIGYGLRGPGRISRIDGALLLIAYVGYTGYLISTVVLAP